MDDSQGTQHNFDDNAPGELWEVRKILDERTRKGVGKQYLIDWEGVNPATGKPWPHDWVPADDVTPEAVQEWKLVKKRKAERKAKRDQGKRENRLSTNSADTATVSLSSKSQPGSSTGASTAPQSGSSHAASKSSRYSHAPSDPPSKRSSEAPSKTSGRKRRASTIVSPPAKRQRSNGDNYVDVELAPPMPKKSPSTRFAGSKSKPSEDSDDPFASDASDEFPPPAIVPQIKFGPPKRRKKPLKEKTPSTSRPAVAPEDMLLTASQRIALRREEEESTQSQERGRRAPSAADGGHSEPRGSSPPQPQKDESRHATPDRPHSPLPTWHPLDTVDVDDNVELSAEIDQQDAQSSHSPVSIARSVRIPLRGRSRTSAIHDEEDDNISIKSQASPQPSPSRLPHSPETLDRPLQPLPQLKPTVFGPFLPSSIIIDDFSSPVKRPAHTQQSDVQNWSISDEDPSFQRSTTEPIVDHQARGLELADLARAKRATTDLLPPARKSIADIWRAKEAAAARERNLRRASSISVDLVPPDIAKALGPTQATHVSQESQTDVGPLADDDLAVRQMEERYVNLEGAENNDPPSQERPREVPPSQEVIPGTESSRGNESSQSQPTQPSATQRLATAMALLTERSEEVRELKRQAEERDARADEARARFESEQKAWHVKEAAWRAQELSWTEEEKAWEAKEKAWEGKEVALNATWAEKENALLDTQRQHAERIGSLLAQVGELEVSRAAQEVALETARANATSEEKKAEEFRRLYMEGTAFVADTRAENETLRQQAEIAASQARNGVALVRAGAQARITKLEEDLQREKALAALLIERARRTDDSVRERAALELEWRRSIGLLTERFDTRDAEADELEHQLKKMARVERKMRARINEYATEVRRLKAAFAANRRPVADGEDDDSEEDGDYVASSTESSEGVSETDTNPATLEPGELGGDGDAEDSLEREAEVRQEQQPPDAESSQIPPSTIPKQGTGSPQLPDDARWMCDWDLANAHGERCQAALRSREDLLRHFMVEHAALEPGSSSLPIGAAALA